MAIAKTIWQDFVDTIAGLTPTTRPHAKFLHVPAGASMDALAGTRDRQFKVLFDSGAEVPLNMCRTEMDVTKNVTVEVAYGVPRNKESGDWLGDIQDDADEIIRALTQSTRQFDVADTTGALIKRVHNGTLDVEIEDMDSTRALLLIGFEITYQRS